MSSSATVYVDVEDVYTETDAAFLVLVDGESYWLPKSQVRNASQFSKGDKNCTFEVAEWIAKDKGIPYAES